MYLGENFWVQKDRICLNRILIRHNVPANELFSHELIAKVSKMGLWVELDQFQRANLVPFGCLWGSYPKAFDYNYYQDLFACASSG